MSDATAWEMAGLRFNLREWKGRARDMEQERDRLQQEREDLLAENAELLEELQCLTAIQLSLVKTLEEELR